MLFSAACMGHVANRSLLTVQRRLGGPECGAGVCAYMHVHVLKKSFSLHSSGDPPDRDGQA